MKRWSALACAAVLCAALCACAPAGPPGDGKISVVATIFAPYDFTRAIAGDRVRLTMLLPPAAESHSYEPTAKDIISIQECGLFLYVGGESENWVREILTPMEPGRRRVVALMDCVDAVEEEIVPGMEAGDDGVEERENGAGTPEYDEHVWTSPKNAMRIVERIRDALCEIDSENAAVYRENARAYLAGLEALDLELRAVVSGAKRKLLVFGDRFPFRYFADEYGLRYAAAFPGCAVETEPSAATVKFLIDKITREKIPVVFHIELSNRRMAQAISEATGAEPLELHSVHSISKQDFDDGLGYLDFMRRNAESLRKALW
ncbi:MAG: metal ABC transporter substrate-binding protein [Oscillospiraceae bacterium]|nr:metal ABC transporter substrate-binding protein [Oscillospiraceae bacterium]